MLPRMNGFAFVQELQRRGLRSRIPVVILTADGRAGEKAAQTGAEGYLAKPFEIEALVAEIARVVEK